MNLRQAGLTVDGLIGIVKGLIKTADYKDGTELADWIIEGDIDDMTPQEIADEWDELPAIETEENTPLV